MYTDGVALVRQMFFSLADFVGLFHCCCTDHHRKLGRRVLHVAFRPGSSPCGRTSYDTGDRAGAGEAQQERGGGSLRGVLDVHRAVKAVTLSLGSIECVDVDLFMATISAQDFITFRRLGL